MQKTRIDSTGHGVSVAKPENDNYPQIHHNILTYTVKECCDDEKIQPPQCDGQSYLA